MDKATKLKLRDAGREDLIKTYYILKSGYAGINSKGNILDRREHKNLVPIPGNDVNPEPKGVDIKVINETEVCSRCDETTYEGYECFCERKKTYWMGVDMAEAGSTDISILTIIRKTPDGKELFHVKQEKLRPKKTHLENLNHFRDKVKELAGYYSIPMDEDKINKL